MVTPAGRGNGTPAYQRIQAVVREQIDSGQLKVGDSVSSERELARVHQVSLMTARHALAELEREGVVQRRRGAGTFIAPPRIHFNKLMSYTEQMSTRGLAPFSKLLFCKVIVGEPEIAARLKVPKSNPLAKIERVRHTAEEPFAHETCYLSAEEFPGLVSAFSKKDSLFRTLEHNYGVELAYADEEVDATAAADGRTAELLGILHGSPLLRIRQVIFSTSSKPVIYVMGIYRSERHSLFIRRFR
jgi:GntR family transcriptional regulator